MNSKPDCLSYQSRKLSLKISNQGSSKLKRKFILVVSFLLPLKFFGKIKFRRLNEKFLKKGLTGKNGFTTNGTVPIDF